jgi:hypothetical protein
MSLNLADLVGKKVHVFREGHPRKGHDGVILDYDTEPEGAIILVEFSDAEEFIALENVLVKGGPNI